MMGLSDRDAYCSLYGDLVEVVPFYKNKGWNHLTFVGRNGQVEFYLDGERHQPKNDFTVSLWMKNFKK